MIELKQLEGDESVIPHFVEGDQSHRVRIVIRMVSMETLYLLRAFVMAIQ